MIKIRVTLTTVAEYEYDPNSGDYLDEKTGKPLTVQEVIETDERYFSEEPGYIEEISNSKTTVVVEEIRGHEVTAPEGILKSR